MRNLILRTIAAAGLVASIPASGAEIVHNDPGGFTTSRAAGSAPFGLLTVDAPITIEQIGSLVDLNGDQDMQFLIFNADTGSNLFASSIQSFIDDGLNYKWSSPLSFTFNPGITYSVGATASVGGQFAVDYTTNSIAGFNFLSYNQNSEGAFGSSVLNTGQNCCDVGTAFRLSAISAPVPEPATWALMLIGFGAVGGAMRSAKRKRNVTVYYA